jgi:hypothetical protein
MACSREKFKFTYAYEVTNEHFYLLSRSSRTAALGSTQSLTGMGTRDISWR